MCTLNELLPTVDFSKIKLFGMIFIAYIATTRKSRNVSLLKDLRWFRRAELYFYCNAVQQLDSSERSIAERLFSTISEYERLPTAIFVKYLHST